MDEKEELLAKIQEILGSLPIGTAKILNVLTRPDLIEYTKRYIKVMDKASLCTNYEAPWSCIKEAEAKYENMKYGWLGADSGVGFSEWWCENCRKKVMDNE